MLRSQDIVLALHLAIHDTATQNQMAAAIGMSQAEISFSLRRLQTSRLLLQDARSVIIPNLLEFCIHGLKYAYPPELGGKKGGVPTGTLVPPLKGQVMGEGGELVWPHPERIARGMSLEPIHACVPGAALKDAELHELLALIDGIRVGKNRVRQLAEEALRKKLNAKGTAS